MAAMFGFMSPSSAVSIVPGAPDRNLGQTHVRCQIDHAGIDNQSAAIDLLRARRNGSVYAHSRDAPVADHERAVLNVRAADRHDARVANDVGRRGRVRQSGSLRSVSCARALKGSESGTSSETISTTAKAEWTTA